MIFLGEDVDDFMALIQQRKGIEMQRKPHDFKPPQPINYQFSYQWLLVLLSFIIISMLVWSWQKNFQETARNLQQQPPPKFETLIDKQNNDKNIINKVDILPLPTIEQEELTAITNTQLSKQSLSNPAPSNREPTSIEIVGSLIAVEDVWMVITDQDKKQIFQDILKENNIFNITNNYKEISITTNSAGSIIYKNNNGQKIPLGEKNEILDNYIIKIQ